MARLGLFEPHGSKLKLGWHSLELREAAFAEEIDRENHRLFDGVWRILGRRLEVYEDAVDICLQTAEAAWRRRNTFKGDAPLSAWLYTIAKNKCIDYWRQKNRVKRIPEKYLESLDDPRLRHKDTAPAPTLPPDAVLDEQFWRQFLRDMIETEIPKGSKMRCILDRTLEGASSAEIALELGDTVARVSALKYWAIGRLKRHLKELGWPGEQR